MYWGCLEKPEEGETAKLPVECEICGCKNDWLELMPDCHYWGCPKCSKEREIKRLKDLIESLENSIDK